MYFQSLYIYNYRTESIQHISSNHYFILSKITTIANGKKDNENTISNLDNSSNKSIIN